MHLTHHLFEQRALVSGLAVLAGVFYLGFAGVCGGESRLVRAGVGSFALVLAPLVWFSFVPPVIGYALICLGMTSAFAFDLALDERERTRRAASLAPRSRVEAAPAIWTSVAALSAAMVVPFALDATQRTAAVIVGVCALLMTAIAWRLASAPAHLSGGDPQRERISQRASRSLKSGVSATLAVAIVFVFASFESQATAANQAQQLVVDVSFWVWIAVWISAMSYAWLVRRGLRTA